MLEVNKPFSPSQGLFHFPIAHCNWAYRAAGSTHTEQDLYPIWPQPLEPTVQQKQIHNHLSTSDIIASTCRYYCEKMKKAITVIFRHYRQYRDIGSSQRYLFKKSRSLFWFWLVSEERWWAHMRYTIFHLWCLFILCLLIFWERM